MDEPIYYSYSGKTEDRVLHGIHATETKAELRQRALMLWHSIRQRQTEAGIRATAAVWIGSSRIQPSVEEVDEYEQAVRLLLAVEKRTRSSAPEPQEAAPTCNGCEQVEEPAPGVVDDSKRSDVTGASHIVLDPEDDLDL
jgi:hypothetical protein